MQTTMSNDPLIIEIRAEHQRLEERLTQLLSSLLSANTSFGLSSSQLVSKPLAFTERIYDFERKEEDQVLPTANTASSLSDIEVSVEEQEEPDPPKATSAATDLMMEQSRPALPSNGESHAGPEHRTSTNSAGGERTHHSAFNFHLETHFGADSVDDNIDMRAHVPTMHSPMLRSVVGTHAFQSAVGLVILINAVFVTIDVSTSLDQSFSNYDARLKGLPEDFEEVKWLAQSNLFFNIFFVLELLARVGSEGLLFILGREWRWNVFDTVLVVSSITSYVQSGKGNSTNLSVGRVLRLLRLGRVLRTLRMLKFFQETRIILTAVLNSVQPLLWSSLVVVLIVYLFSIFMMTCMSEYVNKFTSPEKNTAAQDRQITVVKTYYGSLGWTMLSLFMSVTGGKDWYDIGEIVIRESVLYGLAFIAYIALMLLGMLNIINGVFVQAAADMSKMDRETAIVDETAKRLKLIKSLRSIFIECDDDRSGTLSLEEFKSHMENGQVQAYLAALELSVPQAEVMFKMLDLDESNSISLDEFVLGCLRFKGTAKTLDVGTLLYETRNIKSMMNKQLQHRDRRLLRLEDAVNKVFDAVSKLPQDANKYPPLVPEKSFLSL